jgi:hypothetical protein
LAEKKPFLLRVDRALLESYQRWANDELRSVNGQIEFILRDAVRRAGRMTDDGSELNQGRKTDDGSLLLPNEESGDAAQG